MTILIQLNRCILYAVTIETTLKVKDNLYVHSKRSLMSIQTSNICIAHYNKEVDIFIIYTMD